MSADRITPEQLASWRRQMLEDGDGQFLDPTVAQELAPRLMREIERLWAEQEAIRARR